MSSKHQVAAVWLLAYFLATETTWAQKVHDKVVTIKDAQQNVSGQVVGTIVFGNILRVEKVEGPWLWVEFKHTKGWIDRSQVKDIQGGITYFTDATRRNPKDPENYIALGILHEHVGEIEKAIADYDRGIELDPKHADLYRLRGIARMRKQTKRALDDFNEAIRLYENRNVKSDDYFEAQAHLYRGAIELAAEHYNAAAPDFTLATTLDPKRPEGYSGLGLAYTFMKRKDEAKAQFDKANEIDDFEAELFEEFAMTLPNWVEEEQKGKQGK